jgi:predicted GNAT family N-acyltransferase
MIKFISADETLPLRSAVLRKNLPEAQCRFPTDDQGFHLGYFLNDQLIVIATFFQEDYPELGKGGYRLRGMATGTAFNGQGYGAAVIKFAIDELKKRGATYIWCNARSTAVGFYSKLNFSILSEEFEVPGIGPHFNMSLQLNNI